MNHDKDHEKQPDRKHDADDSHHDGTHPDEGLRPEGSRAGDRHIECAVDDNKCESDAVRAPPRAGAIVRCGGCGARVQYKACSGFDRSLGPVTLIQASCDNCRWQHIFRPLGP